MNKKTSFRLCIALIVSVVLAILMDLLIFNSYSIGHGFDDKTFHVADMKMTTEEADIPLSEEDSKAIDVDLENRRMLAEYNGQEDYDRSLPEGVFKKGDEYFRKVSKTVIDADLDVSYFIGKLRIDLDCDTNAGFTVVCKKDGQAGETRYLNIDPKLDAGVINVKEEADSLELTLLAGEEAKISDMSLTISDKVSLSLLRMAFFFVVFMLIYVMFFAGKKFNEALIANPEYMYFALVIAIGTIILSGIGTNQVSFDEQIHAKKAHTLSYGTQIETTEIYYEMFGVDLPYFNTPEEREIVEAYEDKMNDPSVIAPNISHQSRLPRAEDRVYYPMSAGLFIGRKLGFSFAKTIALGKFGNLLCYALITAYAVRRSKKYEMLTAAIGLIPNNVFLASALSYDGLVNAGLLLGSVLLLNMFLKENGSESDEDETIRWQDVLIMLIAFVIGSLSKPVYMVMCVPLLFLSKKKFKTRAAEVVFKISIIGLIFFMIYNIFFPTPVAGGDYQLVSNAAFSGDKRTIGTSTMGQLSYILSNPFTFIILLLKEMIGMLSQYLIGRRGYGQVPYVTFAYLGGAPFITNWILVLTGVFAAVFSRVKIALTRFTKVLLVLTSIATSAVIFASMYVSYTAVGSDEILGVQGRYFTPLFLYVFACFFALMKHKAEPDEDVYLTVLSEGRYERIIFGIFAFVNLAMIMGLIILKMDI